MRDIMDGKAEVKFNVTAELDRAIDTGYTEFCTRYPGIEEEVNRAAFIRIMISRGLQATRGTA